MLFGYTMTYVHPFVIKSHMCLLIAQKLGKGFKLRVVPLMDYTFFWFSKHFFLPFGQDNSSGSDLLQTVFLKATEQEFTWKNTVTPVF